MDEVHPGRRALRGRGSPGEESTTWMRFTQGGEHYVDEVQRGGEHYVDEVHPGRRALRG